MRIHRSTVVADRCRGRELPGVGREAAARRVYRGNQQEAWTLKKAAFRKYRGNVHDTMADNRSLGSVLSPQKLAEYRKLLFEVSKDDFFGK